MSDLPEPALISQALCGDSHTFGELVLRHQNDVLNVCYRWTGNRQDAEDLAQEVFIRAHKKLNTFSMQYAFGLWVR
ncbi:MAG: hypothetical protein JW757_12195 [Anaerolineales bacterium]|nr:hypothetical protein [Anaerolineales bacterium]